jgi:amino acid transporter
LSTPKKKQKQAPRSLGWHLARWWAERDSDRGADKNDPKGTCEQELGWPENPRWSSVWALFVTALVTAGMLWVTVVLLKKLAPEAAQSIEASLSLVFVAAGVILILVVCTLTIVFRRLLLTDRKEPMGLPRGSVRAVIALLLIMLFFIAVIFLFNSTRNSADSERLRTLFGVSARRFESIPTELIESSTRSGSPENPIYNVTLTPISENTATSDDIAKQLVTTLATLVTAVAAFYFGAGHVQSAIDAQDEKQKKAKRGRG